MVAPKDACKRLVYKPITRVRFAAARATSRCLGCMAARLAARVCVWRARQVPTAQSPVSVAWDPACVRAS